MTAIHLIIVFGVQVSLSKRHDIDRCLPYIYLWNFVTYIKTWSGGGPIAQCFITLYTIKHSLCNLQIAHVASVAKYLFLKNRTIELTFIFYILSRKMLWKWPDCCVNIYYISFFQFSTQDRFPFEGYFFYDSNWSAIKMW